MKHQNERDDMTRTTEKIATVALDGAYNVFTHESSHDVPSDVAAVLTLLPNQIERVVDWGVIFPPAVMDVVATPEGKVIDIRFDLQSIGFLAVRNYCLTAGATPPDLLQVFDDIEDPEFCRIINNDDYDDGIYLLPLLGEAV